VKSADAVFTLRAALYEYDALLRKGIPDTEIARYRAFLERYTALEELTATRRLGYALDDETYGFTRPYLETIHGAWNKLDAAALASAARRHLGTGNLAIVIVTKNGAALANALLSGAPSKPPTYASPKPRAVTAVDEEIVRFPLPLSKENVRVIPVSDVFRE
jgi:zinc protease